MPNYFHGKFPAPGPDSAGATAVPFGQQERRLADQALQSLASGVGTPSAPARPDELELRLMRAIAFILPRWS